MTFPLYIIFYDTWRWPFAASHHSGALPKISKRAYCFQGKGPGWTLSNLPMQRLDLQAASQGLGLDVLNCCLKPQSYSRPGWHHQLLLWHKSVYMCNQEKHTKSALDWRGSAQKLSSSGPLRSRKWELWHTLWNEDTWKRTHFILQLMTNIAGNEMCKAAVAERWEHLLSGGSSAPAHVWWATLGFSANTNLHFISLVLWVSCLYFYFSMLRLCCKTIIPTFPHA